jgi:hypothetical protein
MASFIQELRRAGKTPSYLPDRWPLTHLTIKVCNKCPVKGGQNNRQRKMTGDHFAAPPEDRAAQETTFKRFRN